MAWGRSDPVGRFRIELSGLKKAAGLPIGQSLNDFQEVPIGLRLYLIIF
jgi:hypothetical protein